MNVMTSTDIEDLNKASRETGGRIPIGFWVEEVKPRWRQVICEWPPYTAIGLGVTTALIAPSFPVAESPINDIATTGLTFASIAMGACITAIVLSLGLPGGDRLRKWARFPTPSKKGALSDLVFVLVWATFAQLALIAVCIGALFLGGSLPLAPARRLWTHQCGMIVGFTVFFYAFFALFGVISTLRQIASLVSAEERGSDSGTKSDRPQHSS